MQTLVILAHPYSKSYCHALYQRVVQQLEGAGHTVDRLHLDADGFDPVMRGADLAGYARAQTWPGTHGGRARTRPSRTTRRASMPPSNWSLSFRSGGR